MLFWITEGQDITGATPPLSDYLQCIENLGEAGFRKDHLVIGDRVAIAKIVELDISRRAKLYYQSILTKYATLAGLGRHIKRVYVSSGCYAPTLEERGWTVPLSSFVDVDSVSASILVVEHMYDYEVMVGLADLHLIESRVASLVGLKFFPAAGGGGGTHLSLSTYQRETKSFGVCVLDSDRPHILGRLGSTARTCERVYVNSWRWNMHVVAARELENLIPPSVLRAAGIESPFKIDAYYAEEKWPVVGYADLKVGDSVCRFKRISEESQSYKVTKPTIDRFFADEECCEGEVCIGGKCTLCPPGENLLQELAVRARAGDFRKLRRIPERVVALNDLVSAITAAGAAARWQLT